MSEGPLKVLFYAVVGLFFGIGLFVKGFSWFKQKKQIEITPTSHIRGLAMGPIEIYGAARQTTKTIIKAPFSGEECIYCRYLVEEFRKSGKSGNWVTLNKGVLGRYFYAQDDTGTVLVDCEDAEVDVPESFLYYPDNYNRFSKFKVDDKAKERLAAFMSGHALSTSFMSRRFKEYSIHLNDKLYIMGTAGDNPFVEEATSQKNEADIMIAKGKNFYYISDRPEKEVLKRFRWRVIGGLYGGAALILGCLYVIFMALSELLRIKLI